MALEESKSMLFQRYEMVRSELTEKKLKIQQDAYAQTVGSHDRINQLQHHINTLEAQKNQLCEEKIQMQTHINQMQAWCAQKEKQTGLPAQGATTEGENDFSPHACHTVTQSAKMGGHAEQSSNALGPRPRWGCEEFKN
ncbi:hypothetical protein DQ04_02061100 [Trypanosoma grayi]|uniref:hypothetical protein n=1 Tax=Trypanosoma grayi TaxID=71804 RepID=UPI0004F4B540|nr:hypothetical protein DQ04_02061100 [Trypanosoma grayi]KEG12033.1 hypothetical protein DQ04_02061100 [Trypanosoma grayi]